MIRRQKNRRPIDYVKPYDNIEQVRNDLHGMKRAHHYYKEKREALKTELQEKGLWSDMPEEYRFEMYALRTMMGILEVKITKTTAAFKKLQREESQRQMEEKLKNIEKRAKNEPDKFTSPYQEVDKDGIKYNVTKEHYDLIQEGIKRKVPYFSIKDRKQIMQKIKDASKEISKRPVCKTCKTKEFRENLLDEVKKSGD